MEYALLTGLQLLHAINLNYYSLNLSLRHHIWVLESRHQTNVDASHPILQVYRMRDTPCLVVQVAWHVHDRFLFSRIVYTVQRDDLLRSLHRDLGEARQGSA